MHRDFSVVRLRGRFLPGFLSEVGTDIVLVGEKKIPPVKSHKEPSLWRVEVVTTVSSSESTVSTAHDFLESGGGGEAVEASSVS